MPTRPDQWYRQLQGDRLAPVQLLAGEELLVLEAADALRARARELGYDEREVIDVEARFDWDNLARAAAGMSLFATRRLLDLRLPGGRPGKDGGAAIAAYCKDPPPATSGRPNMAGPGAARSKRSARWWCSGRRKCTSGPSGLRHAWPRAASRRRPMPWPCSPSGWKATCWPRRRKWTSWRPCTGKGV